VRSISTIYPFLDVNKVTRLRPYHGAINKSHATTNKEQANNRATGKKKPGGVLRGKNLEAHSWSAERGQQPTASASTVRVVPFWMSADSEIQAMSCEKAVRNQTCHPEVDIRKRRLKRLEIKGMALVLGAYTSAD
jgi:hypothetical protein